MKKNRDRAWFYVVVNQLAFPGLGTTMAGGRAGRWQMALMVTGFVFTMAYMLWFFLCLYRYWQDSFMTETQFRNAYRDYAWIGLGGGAACVVSWGWALFSSIGILVKERREGTAPAPHPSPSPREVPPPFPSSTPGPDGTMGHGQIIDRADQSSTDTDSAVEPKR